MPSSPSATPRVQRRQRAPEQPPQPSGLGAAAIGAGLAGAAGAAAGAAPTLALARTTTLPVEGLLQALDEFLERSRLYVGRVVGERTRGKLPVPEIAEVIAREQEMGAEFERKARARLTADWARISGLPETDRPAAYRTILEREKRYFGQRQEAVAVRAIRSVERVGVKRESPLGAFWKLGPAEEHTPDCVALAGKIWPWEVLDDLHPPVGPGCVCELFPMGEAVLNGWVGANAKPQRDARRKVELIRTLYGTHGGLKGIREAAALREAIIGTGLADAETASRALTGWLRG